MQNYFQKDLYSILEVKFDINESDLKSAYRKLVRLYHPDVNKGHEEKFKEISFAYEILSDKVKRADYDAVRGFDRVNKENKKTSAPFKASKVYKKGQKKTYREEFDEIVDKVIDEFFSKKEKTQAKNGSDITNEVQISLLEAINGTTRTVNIVHTIKCPTCSGKKFINGTKCRVCKGKGEQTVHKKITVKIPEKVKNGTKIRIKGEGNQGIFGGKNGDLYLKVKIENPTNAKVENKNVEIEVPVSIAEAVLGASIEIPSWNNCGKILMKIPPSTSSGQKFRIVNEGIKENGATGDLIVKIKIETPQNLSNEERKIYERLKILDGRNIRRELFGQSI